MVNDPSIGYYMKELMNGPVHKSTIKIEDLGLPASNRVLKVIITTNCPKETNVNIDFITGKTKKSRRTFHRDFKARAGRSKHTLELNRCCNIHTIEINTDDPVWIESVILAYEDREVLANNIKRLYNNGRIELTQQGNTIGGTVENPDDQTTMLCVPLIYNSHWHTRLDGVEVQAQNINGGLIGLELGPGQHTVELTYIDPMPRLGRIVGAISFGLYLIYLAIYLAIVRRKRVATALRTHRGSEKRFAHD